jgi:hypothetical protein
MTGVIRRIRVAPWLPVALIALGACGGLERGPGGELKVTGTVRSVQSEEGGTCWMVEADGGAKYELQPAQVPRNLLVDGTQATMLVKPRTGFSYCKVGDLVDVMQVDSIQAPSRTAALAR